jgi:hypothetical protein
MLFAKYFLSFIPRNSWISFLVLSVLQNYNINFVRLSSVSISACGVACGVTCGVKGIIDLKNLVILGFLG